MQGRRVGLDEGNLFAPTWKRLEEHLDGTTLMPAYQMFRQARFHAGSGRSGEAWKRSRKGSAAVEYEQISRVQEARELVQARVLHLIRVAMSHQQPDLIAQNSSLLGGLAGTQSRRHPK